MSSIPPNDDLSTLPEDDEDDTGWIPVRDLVAQPWRWSRPGSSVADVLAVGRAADRLEADLAEFLTAISYLNSLSPRMEEWRALATALFDALTKEDAGTPEQSANNAPVSDDTAFLKRRRRAFLEQARPKFAELFRSHKRHKVTQEELADAMGFPEVKSLARLREGLGWPKWKDLLPYLTRN